ncbi:MAG: hypothetical protein QOI35_2981 [Cryptosporangiaceae bacterium]|nr:hypothetical protein [Cryptosporangiaceae bacterium]
MNQPSPRAADAPDQRAAPLLTYRDDATGEQVDLSPAELGTWAARTASLLTSGCGLRSGSRVAVLLPPHWQTAAVLLGSWAAGMPVAFHGWAAAGLSDPPPADAVFAASSRITSWLDTVPEAPHRFALPLTPAAGTPAIGAAPAHPHPEGYRDYLTALHEHGGSPPPASLLGTTAPATTDGTTYREWGSLGAAIAADLGLVPGDRVLVDTGLHEQPVQWLLAPLAAGASIVLWANGDPATVGERAAAEGVTRVL